MKLVKKFDSFLSDVVNIDDARLETLDSRIGLISDYLASDEVIGEILVDVIPQGSMAHKTIIKPLKDHEFDADILIQLERQNGWLAKDYVEEVYKAFRRSGHYKDRVSRKSRCVRVQYANDCHIDVVPYLEDSDELHYITNRTEGSDGVYELTDPTGYSEWLDGQNRIAGRNLVKAIRLFKWLRDYKGTFSCKSVILNILLGERINSANLLEDEKYYVDLPTTLVHLLSDLDQYLDDYPDYMPLIEDPACPGLDYNHRWDDERYQNFREKVKFYASKATSAYLETDADLSLRLWQELFGDQFGVEIATDGASKSLATSGRLINPGEQFIDSMYPLRLNLGYSLRVEGRVLPKNGFRTYNLSSRGSRVEKGRKLSFSIAKCDVPPGYSVFWKIKNQGAAAIKANCLRGEIVSGAGRFETTAYRGNHYVECYIVKDGICVAVDRQPVIVL